MSVLAYRRTDGLYYLVSPDGRVYELRQVNLPPDQLRQAAAAGLILTCDDDGPCQALASPAAPLPSASPLDPEQPATRRLKLLP